MEDGSYSRRFQRLKPRTAGSVPHTVHRSVPVTFPLQPDPGLSVSITPKILGTYVC
jgi:hypothetical protein